MGFYQRLGGAFGAEGDEGFCPLVEDFDEALHRGGQVSPVEMRQPSPHGREEVPERADDQVFVAAFRTAGHFGDDANSKSEPYIGFDDIGVNGRDGDIGLDVRFFKGGVENSATGEAGVVG